MSENPSPSPAPEKSTPRQRTTVYFGCALLLSYAVVLLLVPTAKLSPPLRYALAAFNLIAAATLWLVARQHQAKK